MEPLTLSIATNYTVIISLIMKIFVVTMKAFNHCNDKRIWSSRMNTPTIFYYLRQNVIDGATFNSRAKAKILQVRPFTIVFPDIFFLGKMFAVSSSMPRSFSKVASCLGFNLVKVLAAAATSIIYDYCSSFIMEKYAFTSENKRWSGLSTY